MKRIIVMLRKYRLYKGLSQKELSKLSGISQSLISDIENDVKSPTIRTIEKLAAALGIDPLDLLKRDDYVKHKR